VRLYWFRAAWIVGRCASPHSAAKASSVAAMTITNASGAALSVSRRRGIHEAPSWEQLAEIHSAPRWRWSGRCCPRAAQLRLEPVTDLVVQRRPLDRRAELILQAGQPPSPSTPTAPPEPCRPPAGLTGFPGHYEASWCTVIDGPLRLIRSAILVELAGGVERHERRRNPLTCHTGSASPRPKESGAQSRLNSSR